MALVAYVLALVGFVLYWTGWGDFAPHALLGFSFTMFVLGHLLPGGFAVPTWGRKAE